MSDESKQRWQVDVTSNAFADLAKKMSRKAGVTVVANGMIQGFARFMAREGQPPDQVAAALRTWALNVEILYGGEPMDGEHEC